MSITETITEAAKKTVEFCAENKLACCVAAGAVVVGTGLAINHIRHRRMEKQVANLIDECRAMLQEELEG